MLRLGAVDRLDERVPRREVAVERADSHPGRPGDRFEAGIGAPRAEHRLGDLDQPVAVPPGVGPERTRRVGSIFLRHRESSP